jgi:hypothetical protein
MTIICDECSDGLVEEIMPAIKKVGCGEYCGCRFPTYSKWVVLSAIDTALNMEEEALLKRLYDMKSPDVMEFMSQFLITFPGRAATFDGPEKGEPDEV